MNYLKELRDGEMVSENYFCKQKQTLQTKAGKSYFSLILQDKTGTMDGKVWELNAGIEHFEALDYIRVEGQVVSFQGALQLNIRRVRRLSEGEYDVSEYMPCTKKDTAEMYKELLGYIDSLKDAQFKLLAESYYKEDPKFKEMFLSHSAAKTMHHNFVGGWYLELDSSWASRLTVRSQGNYYELFLWDPEFTETEKILTIYVLTGQSRAEQGESDDRFILHSTDTVTYAASLENGALAYGITRDGVTQNFHLIQRDWKTGET